MPTTRNEGIRLRPFLGVNEIQEAFEDSIKLVVKTGLKTFTLSNRDKLPVNPNQVQNLGLKLIFPEDQGDLKAGFIAAKLKLDEINFVLRIRDRNTGVLRESQIVANLPYAALSQEYLIAEYEAPRPTHIAMNRYTGFQLEAFLVLGSDKEPSPLAPWLTGTILGQAQFDFTTVPEFDSIQPIELTDEIRENLGLIRGVWAHVEFSEDFLEADQLEGSLTFYVDKEVLSLIKAQRKDLALAGQSLLMGLLVPQIVMKSALELTGNEVFENWDGETGVLLRYLQKAYESQPDPAKFIKILKEEPEKVISVILSRKDLKPRLTKLFNKIVEGESDASNSWD
jgi:hypothetical protein